MTAWYPLQFEPVLRRYLWGGRRLADLLGKPLGDGNDYAESWEIVDRRDAQSVVTVGPFAGMTLRQLVEHHRSDLVGSQHDSERFPLLLKFLDCNRDLSIQVHPDDRRAALLDPPDLGKTEAWVILHADPGSQLYAGLVDGATRHDLAAAIKAGNVSDCLHAYRPTVGDCIFIPAGTVHALGAGLVVAEIQQSSNTTYRLFDWNRVDANGLPRPLHIEQGLEATDDSVGPVAPQVPQPTERHHVDRLVECDKFTLDRWSFDGSEQIGGDDRFHIIAVLDGRAIFCSPQSPPVRLTTGETALLPAGLGTIEVVGEACTLLDMSR